MLELVDMDLRQDAAAADAACLFNSDMSTERSNSWESMFDLVHVGSLI